MPRENTMTDGLQLLQATGISAIEGTLDALRLTLPDQTTREVKVVVSETPPTPSKLASILARPGRLLVITERPGRAVMDAAQDNLLDLIILTTAAVTIDGVSLHPEGAKAPNASKHKRQGNPPWGRWAIARALLLTKEPQTQTQLAAAVGISQPAVNKNLKHMADLVHRTDQGWTPIDWSALLQNLLNAYPGPAGASTYWYSLEAPTEQARKASEHAKAMDASPLVSGDVAADVYAPWRLPDKAQVYLKKAVDFRDAGFTPSSPGEATMVATIAEDPTLWLTANLVEQRDPPLADPIITLTEIMMSEAADSKDAAEHLLHTLTTANPQPRRQA